MKLPAGLKFIRTTMGIDPIIITKELGIGDTLEHYGDLRIIEITERETDYVVVVAGWDDNGNAFKEAEYLKHKFIAKKH